MGIFSMVIKLVVTMTVVTSSYSANVPVESSHLEYEQSQIQHLDASTVNSLKIAELETELEGLMMLVASSSEAEIQSCLEDYMETRADSISRVYFGSTRNQIFIAPRVELPKDYKMTERPMYGLALERGEYVSEPYHDFQHNRLIQTISKPLYIEGKLMGVVGIDAYMD